MEKRGKKREVTGAELEDESAKEAARGERRKAEDEGVRGREASGESKAIAA